MHFVKSLIFLLVAASAWGCSSKEDEARPRGAWRAERKALEKFASESLGSAKEIVLQERAAIPDGGSILFSIKTDTGIDFAIVALHDDMHNGSGPQQFSVESPGQKGEFRLEAASSFASQLISLLETCRFRETPDSPPGWPKPTTATRDWLLSRLKNRSIPWGKCP